MTTADFMRGRSADLHWPPPRACCEHMPFAGHRTQGTVIAQHEAAAARMRGQQRLERAMEYGFDPGSIYRQPNG